ncbi:MAG TPA: restriction endonuclease [Candidatus Dependentiae bacterium]|nr:restriction endonuclease [Candidatus Dependentiae bacterium]
MELYIRKASGKKELFDIEKFRRSLEKAGAYKSLIDQLVFEIQQLPRLRTTKEIYGYALNRLQRERSSVAARYNIKHALLELGPAGFPFEQFIADIFRAQGFTATTNQIEQGFCVEHELDIIMARNSTIAMVECKFHNSQKLKTDVKVALYCKARFDDIKKAWEMSPEEKRQYHESWIVTNTKFTSEAIRYANCATIELLGWSYPTHENLPVLIDRHSLYPVTALPYISKAQKRFLIKEGFVLCRDVSKNTHVMRKAGLTKSEIEQVITDANELCVTKNHKN